MIDNSYLLGLYSGTSTSTGSSSTYASLTAARKKQPTAPWSTSSKSMPEASELVRSALGGRKIINEASQDIDVQNASADYKKLFAMYQGLETLTQLANRASIKGVSTSELALLQKRFTAGLGEVGDYLASTSLEGVRLVQGVSSSVSKSTSGVKRDQPNYVTGPIHEGALSSEVAAFNGDVAFSISAKRSNGETLSIDVDLTDMGTTPRTFDNVIKHINTKLEAAGIETRFGREQVEAEEKTITVNGKSVTLPAGADQWALVVKGASTEAITFSAAETSDAVYVTQSVGTAGANQMLKFQSDGGAAPTATAGVGESFWVDGRVGQTTMPEGISTIRASAAGPDGSVWVVADLDESLSGQDIKGDSDVALMKYDAAGKLIYSRTLGAASQASGFAIAVNTDGSVAVAGSVTGALDKGAAGAVATVSDSFVSVYDADGVEQWTQRRGARAEDEATAVSFGSDGRVYVAGRAKSAMPGAAAVGGWDGYLEAYSASVPYPTAATTVKVASTTQFGTTGDDTVQAMTIDGSNLYTAGLENGKFVVRQFSLDANGKATLQSTRDLGYGSGEIAGISVANGQVIVSGTTRNTALNAGTITNAHAGGADAFVASLSTNLQPASSDRLTYFGGAGDDTAADVKVANGKVWITGVSNRAEGADEEDPTKGYLARIDPTSGAVEWSRAWEGVGQQASPATLAVVSGGASVLDRLGLPQGTIQQKDSKLLTSATSLRVGDRFTVSPANGGRATTITIDAKDTLTTLASKIERASGRKLKVTLSTDSTVEPPIQRLSIMARDGKTGAVLSAGEAGRDALAGLGLTPGYVGSSAGNDAIKTFGLNLPKTLSLANSDSTKAAGEALQAAMKSIRDAYRALNPTTTTATTGGKSGGTVPAYYTAQLANYQAALSRLTG